ncbi:MAG: zinc-ribbon domain-containing protein [Phycisphaerae bacterium]
MGGMTFIIVFVVIALTVLGLIVLVQGGRDASAGGVSADEKIICPTCRTANRAYARFCAQCGTSLEVEP